MTDCFDYYGPHNEWRCMEAIENYEKNELNFYVKYGEIGSIGGAEKAYFKQKHRLIWERRHPEIMAERQRQVEQHRQEVEAGNFNVHFWKYGQHSQDKGKMPNLYGKLEIPTKYHPERNETDDRSSPLKSTDQVREAHPERKSFLSRFLQYEVGR